MSDIKSYILVPKLGRGLLTAWSDFNAGEYTDSFATFVHAIQMDNSWQKRRSDVTTVPGVGTAPVWAFFPWNALDTTGTSIQPTTINVLHAGANVSLAGTSTIYRLDTGATIATVTSPHEVTFITVKNRLFMAGATMTPTIATKYPAAASYAWGIASPTTILTYQALTPNNTSAAISVKFVAADINNAGGSVKVWTSTTSAFDNTGAWNGKTLIVNSTDYYTIDTVTATNSLTTTTPGPVAATVNKDWKVQYGTLNWTSIGPSYAYAYYNPNTGHISNIAPILKISEQNLGGSTNPIPANIDVMINNIPVTADANYTRIILFRTTADGGGNLYPMKLVTGLTGTTATITAEGYIDNTVGAGNYSYHDNLLDNQLFIVFGGLPAPFSTNDPPPTDLRFIAYWDGRFWGSTTSKPFQLRYSGGLRDIPLGVSEECWPQTNFIEIPTDEGNCTGMRTIGDNLIICTDRFLYYVQGNGAGSYQLARLSTRGFGVNHWAIDEHPGDNTSYTAAAVYISRDKKMWLHYPGGRIVDIGWPIQDKLDAADMNTPRPFLVRIGMLQKHVVCAVGIRGATNANAYDFYFYDFDKQVFYDWGFAGGVGTTDCWSVNSGSAFNSSMPRGVLNINRATALNAIEVESPLASWIAAPNVYFETKVLDFGDRAALKSIEKVLLYTDDNAVPSDANWACDVRFEGVSTSYIPLTKIATTGTPRFKGKRVIEFVFQAQQSFHGAQFRFTFGSNASFPSKIFKIDFRYVIESTAMPGIE